MKKYIIYSLLVVIVIGLTAFSSVKKKKESFDYVVTISTDFGDMKLILFDDTPIHKSNFIELAETGKYDSTIFHRIINNFMIQGGGLKMKDMSGWDTLSFDDRTLPNEIMEKHKHLYGAVAAARTENPTKRSDNAQFYIVNNTKGSHFLDNNYTVFGQLIVGFDVLQKISATPTDNTVPKKKVYMTVHVDKVKRSDIIIFYGDIYQKYGIGI